MKTVYAVGKISQTTIYCGLQTRAQHAEAQAEGCFSGGIEGKNASLQAGSDLLISKENRGLKTGRGPLKIPAVPSRSRKAGSFVIGLL
jgi:hypothetical protein